MPNSRRSRSSRQAFSLVELSIVLVILGLLVGTVLTGRSLVEASELNATLAQLSQIRSATSAFRDKYLGLPGDLANAAAFGFHSRQACQGFGDGDGFIEGIGNINQACNTVHGAYGNGEVLLFWQDLWQVGLVQGNFVKITDGLYGGEYQSLKAENCFPKAKIANHYFNVWAGGPHYFAYGTGSDGRNYFSLSNIVSSSAGSPGCVYPTGSPAMKVQQVYNIDTKLDDGLPQSGAVMALYPAGQMANWAAGGGSWGSSEQTCCNGGADFNQPTTRATPYASTNCYDNNNVVGKQIYTLSNADTGNCALSFRF